MANLGEGEYGEFGDYGEGYLSQADAGSGAYTVKSHNKQDITVMTRFDDYFLPFPENAPDEVRMRYGLEDATLRAMMSRGEHDVSSMWHPFPVYKALDALDGISAVMEPQAGGYYVKINTQRPPTDDKHLRRALALALDYDALAELITVKDGVAGGTAARGPIPASLMGHDESLPFRGRDIEAAKAELAKSNYDAETSEPVRITSHLCCATHAKVALLMAANLAEIGVKTELQEMPWPLVMESAATIETTPNLTPMVQITSTPDVDPLLYELYHSSSTGQWHNMEWLLDDEVDGLLAAARGEMDEAKREALYQTGERTAGRPSAGRLPVRFGRCLRQAGQHHAALRRRCQAHRRDLGGLQLPAYRSPVGRYDVAAERCSIRQVSLPSGTTFHPALAKTLPSAPAYNLGGLQLPAYRSPVGRYDVPS